MSGRKSYLLDKDGVLVRGQQPIPGAQEFIARLYLTKTPFLVITNNSEPAKTRAGGDT